MSENVGEMLSTACAKEKADNRMALYTIISIIRFPAHQCLPVHGVMLVMVVVCSRRIYCSCSKYTKEM